MVENSERYAEILKKIVNVLLEDGVTGLSLRPLAEKVGSSARLLIYHFGTKENLIKSALAVVHAEAEQALRELGVRAQPTDLRASLMLFWEWTTEEFNQRYFRLMFEADGLSMHGNRSFSEDFKNQGGLIWLQMIDRATKHLPQNKAAVSGRSTLIMAALNGLLQDYFSTGDHTRTMEGLQYLIGIVDGEAGTTRSHASKKSAQRTNKAALRSHRPS